MNPLTDHVHNQPRSSSTLSLKFTGNRKLKQKAEEEDMVEEEEEEEEEGFEEDEVGTEEDDEFEKVGREIREEMIQLKKKRIDLDSGILSAGNKKSKSASSAAAGGGSGGGAGGTPPLICKVENCRADLTDSKKYHKRHRVCEYHAKAQVAIVDGLRQRFCQQCSRFHELPEFDDTKRSCRRRLEGHNARRRKSSMESRGEGLDHGRSRLVPTKKDQCRLVQERGRGQMVFPKNHRNLHIHS